MYLMVHEVEADNRFLLTLGPRVKASLVPGTITQDEAVGFWPKLSYHISILSIHTSNSSGL